MQYPQPVQSFPLLCLYSQATSWISSKSFSLMEFISDLLAISMFSFTCFMLFIPLRTVFTSFMFQRYWKAHSTGVLLSSAISHNSIMSWGIFCTNLPPLRGSIIIVPKLWEAKYSTPSFPDWYLSSR